MPNDVNFRRLMMLCASACLPVIGCGCSPAALTPTPAASGLHQPREQREVVAAEFEPEAQLAAQAQSKEGSPASPAPTALPASGDQQVVARINGRAITMAQLQKPLVEAYGLTMLLNLVQLELAGQQAREAGVSVSEQDVVRERKLTLIKLFPEAEPSDYEALFEQFLQQQRLTRAEFDILLQTNSHLRKIVEPQVRGRVTEENLQEAYRQMYGETVQVRHIQLANMAEVAEVKRRLSEGEPFELLAQALSRNQRTGAMGGELPPFSRAYTGYPQAFRDAAFTLQPGEISDPVQAEGSFHLIQMIRRIEPKAVQYEDVKDTLREDLEDKLIQAGMNQVRSQLGKQALQSLQIDEPVLRKQYEQRLENRDAQVRDRDQVRQEWERQRRQIQERQGQPDHPTAAPATLPAMPLNPASPGGQVDADPGEPSSSSPDGTGGPVIQPTTLPAGHLRP
jgi:parvulin-like peptidyl-prolyl isomerase